MIVISKVIPLFSGSKGNCYYIQSGDTGILLDCGCSAKQITTKLKEHDIDPKSIHGVFVTHEHTDHIKGVRVLCSRNNIPVYGSQGTLKAMLAGGHLEKVDFSVIPYTGLAVGDLLITPFETSHDAAESIGFKIITSDDRKICLATDLGYVSSKVSDNLTGSDLVILESNHDVGMLKNGFYPYELKMRILSPCGHLSNEDSAKFATELVKSGTTRIILSHLSEENNTQELAFQTSLCALKMQGMEENVDFRLYVAPVENNSGSKIVL